LEKSVLELFLPEGILEYFDIQSTAKTQEGYVICLAEKNLQPLGFKGEKLSSKGYLDEVTIKDFPIRGKACYLKVRRRRWINEDTGEIVVRDWELVAKGTRMTKEFASFLKGLHRQ